MENSLIWVILNLKETFGNHIGLKETKLLSYPAFLCRRCMACVLESCGWCNTLLQTWLLKKTRNLLCHTCGGQQSEISVTGPKLSCHLGHTPSKSSSGDQPFASFSF